jgi:predicted nucleic acid-binding protein
MATGLIPWSARRQQDAPIDDTWIAATAIANGVPIVTQDSDYDVMPDVEVIRI